MKAKGIQSGLYILDLNSLGYDKLLGGGQVNGKFEVRINRISDKAREKVEQSGGEVVVISNEKYNAK